MAVAAQVVAFAVELHVFRLGKGRGMQAMGGAERALHPEEIISARPILREKIFPLMQTNAVDGQLFGHARVDVLREGLRRLRKVRKAVNFVVEILVIEFGPKRLEHTTRSPVASFSGKVNAPGNCARGQG